MTQLVIGEQLLGSCAVFHVDDREASEIEISLVPRFELFGGERRGVEQYRATPKALKIPFPAGAAGRALPFQITLPSTLAPSFRADTHALNWELTARHETLDATIPIDIFDGSAASRTQPLDTVPAVADQRVAALFAEHARGWQVAEPDVRAQIVAERVLAKSRLRLAYEYRGERGTFLVGSIAHRPLGLGLVVTRPSIEHPVFANDIEIGDASWDRKYHVTARYAAQATPVMTALAKLLSGSMSELVSWTEDRLLFEEAISALEGYQLRTVIEQLERMAETVEEVRASIAPPADIDVDLAGWHALAHELDGELVTGDLSITGRLGRLPVSLGLTFSDTPIATGLMVSVGSGDTASKALRELAMRSPAPATDDHPDRPALGILLHDWPADFVDLVIEGGVASATWQLPRWKPALHARARELVDALAQVIGSLDESSPYR